MSDSLEGWLAFRKGEQWSPSNPRCVFCGGPCSGDTVDGELQKPVCDDPDTCPALADDE